MRALMIREDVPPSELRRLAKAEDDPRVARRLLAIAAALEGMREPARANPAGPGLRVVGAPHGAISRTGTMACCRALEELPPEVRRALWESLVDWCPLRAREWHLHLIHKERLKPAKAASVLVRTIRKMDHVEVAAFARRWPKGAKAYPHLAVGASIQRYSGRGGLPGA